MYKTHKYFFIISIILLSCGDGNKVIKDDTKSEIRISKALDVGVDIIKSKPFINKLLLNGKIEASHKTDLSFNISNKIIHIPFNNGQWVKKGEVIAVLENSILKNNIEKFKIELLKAESKLVEDKINFSNEITPKNLKNLEIRSGLLDAKNNLKRAKLEYSQTYLKAPFSSLIANLNKNEGDLIKASEVFCTLLKPNNLEVSFSILENEFSFVEKGQEIEVKSFNSESKIFKGKITEINPIVNENGLIHLKARIINENTSLLDGMNVKVFVHKPLTNVIVIPKEALVIRSNKQIVFTLENQQAKWNNVKIKSENDNSFAITSGLKKSDTIIVSGNLNLSHDTKVNAYLIEKTENEQ